MPKPSLHPKRTLGRPPRPRLTDSVRAYSSGKNKIRFTFTADVIKKLLDMHMNIWMHMYLTQVISQQQRHRHFRLEFARLADIRIPAVFVRIEPPTYDPRGRRIRKITENQLTCEITAPKIKVRWPIPPTQMELLWADQGIPGGLNGLIMTFPDEYMIYDGPKLPAKISGILTTLDLVAR
jgi:hypothetical protein